MKRDVTLSLGVCLAMVFVVLFAGHVAASEATITGEVTPEGTLKADHGTEYLVSGAKAEELSKNKGKKITVKGTVQVEPGKVLVDVREYKLMQFEETMTKEAALDTEEFASCTEWVNCNPWSPTYTGTCCRFCKDGEGEKRWDCQIFSVGEHFDVAEW